MIKYTNKSNFWLEIVKISVYINLLYTSFGFFSDFYIEDLSAKVVIRRCISAFLQTLLVANVFVRF